MIDEEYMGIALELAKRGAFTVSPNPMVGAIIVKDNEIIGEGWHEVYGGLHAERNAFKNCKCSAFGATLYVTLEPCCHYGKTPPCTQIIIEQKIKRVVIGSCDPNPLVAGKGIEQLKEAGIEVVTGVLETQCKELNHVFFHYIQTKTPYVTMKYAMTMDGKIATKTGESQWITNQESRMNVHRLRSKVTGIMVGVGTVIADDPMLTCRIEGGKNPIRIICDTNLRTPYQSKVVTTAGEIRTIIATASEDCERILQYRRYGCDIIQVSKKENYIDLDELMHRLGELEIDSVLLEGGATLNASALQSRIVQRVQAYIAPMIFGGKDALTPIEGDGVEKINCSYQLKKKSIQWFENDLYIESEVEYPCLQEL